MAVDLQSEVRGSGLGRRSILCGHVQLCVSAVEGMFAAFHPTPHMSHMLCCDAL